MQEAFRRCADKNKVAHWLVIWVHATRERPFEGPRTALGTLSETRPNVLAIIRAPLIKCATQLRNVHLHCLTHANEGTRSTVVACAATPAPEISIA